MLQLFTFLGKVKSLEDAAQKLTALAMSADKKEVAEEAAEDKADEGMGILDDLYVNN